MSIFIISCLIDSLNGFQCPGTRIDDIKERDKKKKHIMSFGY